VAGRIEQADGRLEVRLGDIEPVLAKRRPAGEFVQEGQLYLPF
jgi:hypothetical protein